MIFDHNTFDPRYELETIENENGRFYVLPNGEHVKSVTTIIKEKSNTKALDNWKKKVGEEEARKISFQATSRGDIIHKLAETYLLNQETNLKKEMPIDQKMFRSLIPHLDEISNIRGLEFPLFSYGLKTAGRTDCIADFRNIPSVIDFKGSDKKKIAKWIKHYFIQGTCYAMMAEEMYGVKIPQVVILIGVEYEKPQIFIKDSHEFRDEVKEMFA